MKASQYKAIRSAGVEEFAIYPADVEASLPYAIQHANRTASLRACPTGLVRATIVEDDVEWSESFTLGCGDTEYQRKRRNGVLVEVALEDYRAAWKRVTTIKGIADHPRRRVVRRPRDGGRVVEMIVSKAAILAPWNEYALIEAEREKEQAERAERGDRLDAVVKAVGARDGRFTEVHPRWDKEKDEYAPPPRGDYDYTFTADRLRGHDVMYLRGEVILSLKRAEEIAALLGAK